MSLIPSKNQNLLSDAMDSVKALVEIFAIPPPDKHGQQDVSTWPCKPLFRCILHSGNDMISGDGSVLVVNLETEAGALIARSYLTPSSNLRPCGNSVHRWTLEIQNGELRAILGVSFVDRSDSVDFSFITQCFVRKFAECKKIAKYKNRKQLSRGRASDKCHLELDLKSESRSDSEEFGEFQ